MAAPDTASVSLYHWMFELTQIGNTAVQQAQAGNRRQGIPNAYSHRGRLYFELPTGELTLQNPFEAEHPAVKTGV